MKTTIQSVSTVYLYHTDRKSWVSAPSRQYHILSYQLDGEYIHHFADETLTVKKDTLFLLNRNSRYTVRCVTGGSSICVTFSADGDFPTRAIDCAQDPHILNCFRRLTALTVPGSDADRLQAMSILYDILAFAEGKTGGRAPAGADRYEKELTGLYALMTERYADSGFDIYREAEKLGLKERHFRELFRRRFGTTPTRCLTELRLRYASELLSAGGLSVSAVAQMAGFSDVYYFSRVFRKHFSVPPSRYHAPGK